MCKYDPIEQTIFIVLKQSIQQQSFTLHLLALAEVILSSFFSHSLDN